MVALKLRKQAPGAVVCALVLALGAGCGPGGGVSVGTPATTTGTGTAGTGSTGTGTTGSTIVTTLLKHLQLGFGSPWAIPVYDGTDLVVSVEQSGEILVARFDLALNQLSSPVVVAGPADTFNNDTIADHKHVFQNGHHYLTFSISGGGTGGYLYLMKLDSAFQRVGFTTVVANEAPTNDMFMVGDGQGVHVGKFLPGWGHRVYSYDQDLNLQASVEIGDGAERHANGASAIFDGTNFHLVAPETLAPGQGDEFYRIIFDTSWNVVGSKETILTDPTMLGIVSGLSIEPQTQSFVVHYSRADTDKGGDLYEAVYDSDWNLLSNQSKIAGEYQRPHSVIVSDRLYVAFDGGGADHLTEFSIN